MEGSKTRQPGVRWRSGLKAQEYYDRYPFKIPPGQEKGRFQLTELRRRGWRDRQVDGGVRGPGEQGWRDEWS